MNKEALARRAELDKIIEEARANAAVAKKAQQTRRVASGLRRVQAASARLARYM